MLRNDWKCDYIFMFPEEQIHHHKGNTLRLKQNGHHFADNIIFLNAISWIKSVKFNWSLFLMLQLRINHHWFRLWFDATKAMSHCLELMMTQFTETYMRHSATMCQWRQPGLPHSLGQPKSLGGGLNIQQPSYQYSGSYYKDKMVSQ